MSLHEREREAYFVAFLVRFGLDQEQQDRLTVDQFERLRQLVDRGEG